MQELLGEYISEDSVLSLAVSANTSFKFQSFKFDPSVVETIIKYVKVFNIYRLHYLEWTVISNQKMN